MKILPKVVAILVIATTSIVLLKNYLIEYAIQKELSTKNIEFHTIECRGLYCIDCNLNKIKVDYYHNNILYSLEVKSLSLSNILEIYSSYNKRTYPNSPIAVIAKDIILKDNQNIFREISKKIAVNMSANSDNFQLVVNREDFNISIEPDYNLSISTQNLVTHKILYELYKFAFLEMKSQDGLEIASGLNISLGHPTSDFIPEEFFLQNSISRVVDLSIAEIESYDEFVQYNDNNQLSNILEFILREEGDRKFNLVLPNIIENGMNNI